ncbi:hypothetical protein Tco_0654465 [Tanacetum coccineum]|uniref:RRM domain-containing protein n=1 Tax=Tanacetum coccineum TaxID=301880 RepID=A0ABQ4X3A1_9ASTR
MASNPENVRLNVLMKLQEALDEEAILEEQILTLMHHFADRFTERRVEINNLMVLQDHPLIDYGKYALGCMTRANMKKCVYLKSIRDELQRRFLSLSIRLCSTMGSRQWYSKEDQTLRISKSVFVTNFPETYSFRDLWKVCNDYGSVVDVFIPIKKSKACKRFAFVRFIKVKDLDRLVANLCTI